MNSAEKRLAVQVSSAELVLWVIKEHCELKEEMSVMLCGLVSALINMSVREREWIKEEHNPTPVCDFKVAQYDLNGINVHKLYSK